MKYEYYYQEAAASYINRLREIPDRFPVHADYCAIAPDELTAGLKGLRKFMDRAFSIAMEHPDEYGIFTYTIPNQPSKQATQERYRTWQSFERIIKTIYGLLICAIPVAGNCQIDAAAFSDYVKAKDTKITWVAEIIKLLNRAGLEIYGNITDSAGFVVAYPDDLLMLPAAIMYASAINGWKLLCEVDVRVFADNSRKGPAVDYDQDFCRFLGECDVNTARHFKNLAESAKCKMVIQPNKCIFTLKKEKTVLAGLYKEDNKLIVKLNLPHLGEYIHKIHLRDDIKRTICAGLDCGNCNPRCNARPVFSMGGIDYRKCAHLTFYFKDVLPEQLAVMTELLKNENKTVTF